MENQKRENLLNLALDATEEERLKSVNLNVGYDPEEKTWELIVRHNGSLEALRNEGIRVDELAAGYAVLVVPESRIDQVSAMEQIVYIEKPKRLFFASNMAAGSLLSKHDSDQQRVRNRRRGAGAGVISGLESGLTGRGVLVAVIDSGIDYFHSDFRNPDGTTRIGLLADQDRDRIYTRGGDQRRPGNREPVICPGAGAFHRPQRPRDSGGSHCGRKRKGGKRCLPGRGL
ncbi:MAG: hypothetical protein ACLR0U_03085 [Enterocloster clostridioformis]